MPQAIGAFRQRHPDVELSLTEHDSLASLARVKSGELDLALMYEYDFVPFPEDDSVEQTFLMDDPIRVIRGSRRGRSR
jgi:DNA-binding transcriptional LysR family regulator